MSDSGFPRTTVGGVSLSRMIIGTNWILGFSHTSSAADALIARTARNPEAIAGIVAAFLERGVDAMMGLFGGNDVLCDGVKIAEDRVGRGVVRIDTPIVDVADSAKARQRAAAEFDASRAAGAAFCMPHHTSVEQLVDKGRQAIHRLPDYLSMIRERGMVPGLSAHMPEVVVYADANGYDVETYIQIYNCAGFLMQVEVEYINRVIWNAKKPVMTIKPMAAGRVSPFVGLSFSWGTIRPYDLVTVGCLTPEEAAEDVEISLAAIERRRPDLDGRASPKKTEIMK
jgi:hypothetical protein